MSTDLIPVFSGTLCDESSSLVNARDLHAYLEVGKRFASWITERIEEYGFIENQDFVSFSQNGEKPQGGRPSKDYHLSLDMGKELAMVERNEKGRIIRRYFIECEKRLRVVAPEQAHAAAQTVATITPAQQGILFQIVARRAGEDKKIRAYFWSRFSNHYHLNSYKNLPAAQFDEAVAYLEAMPLKGEPAEPPKALPLEIHFPLESAAPPVGCTGLSYYAFTQAKDWVDPGWELLMKLKAAGHNVDGPIYSHRAKIHVMTAMYNVIIGKAVESLNGACASLPYAPVYLR